MRRYRDDDPGMLAALLVALTVLAALCVVRVGVDTRGGSWTFETYLALALKGTFALGCVSTARRWWRCRA